MQDLKEKRQSISQAIESIQREQPDVLDPVQVIIDHGLAGDVDLEMPPEIAQRLESRWQSALTEHGIIWADEEAKIADSAFQQYTQVFYLLDLTYQHLKGIASIDEPALFGVIEDETKLLESLERLLTGIVTRQALHSFRELGEVHDVDNEVRFIGTVARHTLDAYGELAQDEAVICTGSTSIHPTRQDCLNSEHLIKMIDYYPDMVSESLRERLAEEESISR